MSTSATMLKEYFKSSFCSAIERIIQDAANCPWTEGTKKIHLLRDAIQKFDRLREQTLDTPTTLTVVEEIREGFLRPDVAKRQEWCSGSLSLQQALERLDDFQVTVAECLKKVGDKMFDERVWQLVAQCNRLSVVDHAPLGHNELLLTARFLITLLPFMGHLCTGSTLASDIIARMVPSELLIALLHISDCRNWHGDEISSIGCNTTDAEAHACDGLCDHCLPVKQAVLKFLLHAHLQPGTGCCGYCPSGSGRGAGFAGLKPKWLCDCGPSCVCFYRSPGVAAHNAYLGASAGDDGSIFDDIRLPVSASAQRQKNCLSPMSQPSISDSAGSEHYHRQWLPKLTSSRASDEAGVMSPALQSGAAASSPDPSETFLYTGSQAPTCQASPIQIDMKQSRTLQNEPPRFTDDFAETHDLAADLWDFVGKTIAQDLRNIAREIQSPMTSGEATAILICYAMKSVAPCVVKCHPGQIEEYTTSIFSSLREIGNNARLPDVARMSIGALVLLYSTFLQSKEPHKDC